MKRIISKLFVGGHWMVGYRPKAGGRPRGEYQKVDAPDGCWIADPFLYEVKGKHYLFVELYKAREGKAGIGYYEFRDGHPVYIGMAIDQPYHMSYPCIFSYRGEHYIIPESSANNTIELFRAEHFPDVWVKEKELLTGEKYVDSTVYRKDEEYYLLSYKKEKDGWELDTFELDMEQKCLCLLHSKHYKTNTGRPAGFLQCDTDTLYRPVQNCKRKYGESVLMCKVVRLDRDVLEEQYVSEILPSEILFSEKHHRVHTVNQDSEYEVVDIFREKIDILHGWRIFKRSHKNDKSNCRAAVTRIDG